MKYQWRRVNGEMRLSRKELHCARVWQRRRPHYLSHRWQTEMGTGLEANGKARNEREAIAAAEAVVRSYFQMRYEEARQ